MLNKQLHKVFLIKILKAIYQNKKISSSLVFKGGTCVYLFYELDRFSTDLDFSLIGEIDKKLVFNEVKKILLKMGTLKDSWIKANTILFEFSYKDTDSNIKIEISKRNEDVDYEVKNYLGINILTMTKEQIFANKLLALTERKKLANRDIYDLYFFFKNNFPIDENVIEQATGKSFEDYLVQIKNFLLKINSAKIMDGLGEVIDSKKKKWIKENLIKELISEVEIYLASIK